MSYSERNLLAAEYDSLRDERQVHLDKLKGLIVASGVMPEGGCFYNHNSFDDHPSLKTKQLNLFWVGKQATTSICEIGFNAGHSAMVMLLGRERTPLQLTVFDIGTHPYTRPCMKYIESQNPEVKIEYVEGDSINTLPAWLSKNRSKRGTYDVVHVDGGHYELCISNDMRNADQLVRVGGLIVVDDTNMDFIDKHVDRYLSTGNYTELEIVLAEGYRHRIIQKLR